jgi:hypothetical protein
MFRFLSTGNIALLRRRLANARAELVASLPRMEAELGFEATSDLASASPKGKSSGGGQALPGDAPGPLASSFVFAVEEQGEGVATLTVGTTQPTKLKFVTEGTGIYGPTGSRIVPTSKKALFWPQADHPYASVKGMQANPFVEPVLKEAQSAALERRDALVESVLSGLEMGV